VTTQSERAVNCEQVLACVRELLETVVLYGGVPSDVMRREAARIEELAGVFIGDGPEEGR